MSILVTGGTGFIGWNITRRLVEKGKEVILFDIAQPRRGQNIEGLAPKVKFRRGDLSSWPDVLEVIKRNHVKEIFHTGAMLSEACEENPLAAYMVNINGTFNLLEASVLFEVEKVTFISSVASYSLGQEEVISSKSPQRPHSMYGVTKVCGELLGEYFNRRFGLDFRCVRLPSIIGPGRGGGGLSSYTTLMIQEPALGRPYEVYVSEDTRCPILYYKDAVRCLIQLHEAPVEMVKTRSYCIAGHIPTAAEIAEMVKEKIPDAKIIFRPDPEKTRIVKSWAQKIDESEANIEWGWRREYSLEESIEDFIREVRESPDRYI
ncbi:MAG: NAD-dependent epimerase/dehydratase family protein [Candidatus Bathyarchaeia archaeon]